MGRGCNTDRRHRPGSLQVILISMSLPPQRPFHRALLSAKSAPGRRLALHLPHRQGLRNHHQKESRSESGKQTDSQTTCGLSNAHLPGGRLAGQHPEAHTRADACMLPVTKHKGQVQLKLPIIQLKMSLSKYLFPLKA